MDIWLDTTDIKTISLGSKLGILTGVTTNPSLIAQSEKSLEENLDEVTQKEPKRSRFRVVVWFKRIFIKLLKLKLWDYLRRGRLNQ